MRSRNRNLLCVLLVVAVSKTGYAQGPKFPYKARVISSETYARSGGGENFYPTQVLPKDSIVTVRRHDPGGWYKIDPPKGSFSWIATTYVRQTSANTGVVSTSGAIVSVGSQFGDETTVWQRKMLPNEEVQLLGQQIVETEAGPRKMYKIAPPAREYRWVSGRDILPIDQQALTNRDSDPYAVPSEIIKQNERIAEQRRAENPQTAAPAPKYSPSQSLARIQNIRKEKLALRQLDRDFRNMLQQQPNDWKLDQIEQRYQKLQETSSYPPIAGQIDLRYPAINRYRIRKAEFDDFQRMTSATEKRDAELLAAQYGIPPNETLPNQTTPNEAVTQNHRPEMATGPLTNSVLTVPEVSLAQNGPAGVFAAPSVESPVNGLPTVAATQPPIPEGSTPTGSTTPQQTAFVGAGYVQRGITAESEYVLMSPAGKILAHLNPEQSVDLESHIGQSVGLKGKRFFDSELSKDRINVSGLQRVRLRQ